LKRNRRREIWGSVISAPEPFYKPAAREPPNVKAVVSRGGRPDLAEPYLPSVAAPTLLIVGGPVIETNQTAYDLLTCEKKLVIVPGATHLFEEPGTLKLVAEYQPFKAFKKVCNLC
jgi:hypothetical protein